MELSEKLLTEIRPTKIISGRASIQAVLDELGRSETDKATGTVLKGGGAIFFAPELSAGVVNDPEAIKILTDIYDFRSEYTSRLRGSGVFKINNVCFSMLAASNEELLKDFYDSRALYGGLLGRTFLVKASEFRPANSLFDVRDTSESFSCLVSLLTVISKATGEFEIDASAQKAYDAWYEPFRRSYEHRSDNSGVAGRIHTSVLKLAMILCINETGGESLEICECHIQEAIKQCMALMPNYQSFIMSSGKSTVADVAACLIEEIWQANGKKLGKRDFVSRHFSQFDLDVIDKCITTLETAGLIQSTINNNDYVFQVTPKCLESFPHLKENKP